KVEAPLGIEETVRYFAIDGLMRAMPDVNIMSGAAVVRGCRMIKSPAEIALMPQAVRDGEVVLMDCGCTVQGYQSDISRTFVFGEANAEQRKVWKQMREGQRIAIETARVGVPAGAVDDAVR